MKGDFTRSTFDPSKHYSGVRMQQGRVLLDADWNEQLDIQRHRDDFEASDALGRLAVPRAEPQSFQVVVESGMPKLRPGRIYVDGILCENEVLRQLDALPDQAEALPSSDGGYLCYLDVCRHHVTALEDPSLLDAAVGGADTTTRDRVVWQVRWLPFPPSTYDAADRPPMPGWLEKVRRRRRLDLGRMTARARPGETVSTTACMVPTVGGYQRTENALYRVEIHQEGEVGTATYKWSRDNGATVARCTSCSPEGAYYRLHLGDGRRDAALAFSADDHVELTHDAREVNGLPGVFAVVRARNAEEGTIDVEIPAGEVAGLLTWFAGAGRKVRRWEAAPAPITAGGAEVETAEVELSAGGTADGVMIRFLVREEGAALRFYTGDHWVVPARVGVAEIPWPRQGGGALVPMPPAGVVHHYTPLARLTLSGGAWSTTLTDYRELTRFPGLSELRQLVYLGEPVPVAGLPNEFDLKVGVSMGQWMVPGASVKFSPVDATVCEVMGGGGWTSEGVQITGSNGVATSRARLIAGATPTGVNVWLESPILGEPRIHAPMHFVVRRQCRRVTLPTSNLLLDLDAERNITVNTSDKVTSWQSCVDPDHVAEPEDDPPLIVYGAMGCRAAVRFTGTEIVDIADGLSSLDKPVLTLYVVGVSGESADRIAIGRRLDGSGVSRRWSVGLKSLPQPSVWHNGTSFFAEASDTHSWGTPAIWSHCTSENSVRRNDVPFEFTTTGTFESLSYGDNSGTIRLGEGLFDIARVLIYDVAHDDDTRRKVVSYLAQEYGIALGR